MWFKCFLPPDIPASGPGNARGLFGNFMGREGQEPGRK